MNSILFQAPVALHVGRGCLSDGENTLSQHGGRCFVLTSRFAPGCRNLALEDACRELERQNIRFTVWDEVEENPSVESIRRVTDAMLEFKPDFLLAIGGGSALDTAKAANVLIAYPKDTDAYEVFFSGQPARTGSPSRGKLRLIGIPTTAGSGAEVAGYAVLTRTDLDTKIRMNPLSFFNEAFLDARYIEDSPDWLIDAGALDALAHGMESSLHVDSNYTSRMLSDFGLTLFSEYKDRLLSRTLRTDDYDSMLLAASVQGMAVVQASTTLPHGMGYPLTHEKHLTHGIASCLCLGEYLSCFREEKNRKTVSSILEKAGFERVEDFNDWLSVILRRNIDFTVTEEEIARWSEQLFRTSSRLSRHPEEISLSEIRNIYERSFERLGNLV